MFLLRCICFHLAICLLIIPLSAFPAENVDLQKMDGKSNKEIVPANPSPSMVDSNKVVLTDNHEAASGILGNAKHANLATNPPAPTSTESHRLGSSSSDSDWWVWLLIALFICCCCCGGGSTTYRARTGRWVPVNVWVED